MLSQSDYRCQREMAVVDINAAIWKHLGFKAHYRRYTGVSVRVCDLVQKGIDIIGRMSSNVLQKDQCLNVPMEGEVEIVLNREMSIGRLGMKVKKIAAFK